MANDKDFIIKNAVEIGGSVKTTVGTLVSGTTAYSLFPGSYDSKSFDHGTDAGIVLGMYMKSDGTKMYLSSSGSGTYTDSIIEYDLSTAWDISTASYGANISVASQDTTPYGVFLKPDGLTMFVLGRATGSVYQYTLSTAWDVSSATYVSKSFDFTTQITLPSTGFFFKSDGSIMYVMENTASTNVNVYQYSLSTAWDVSSATYPSKSYAINDGLSASLFFTSDGTEMYHNVYSNSSGLQDIVRKHTLSTAWDISTASVSTETLDVSGQDTTPYSLWFKPDGSKLYVGGATTDTIYQYSTVITTNTLDLSTGSVFEVTPTSDIQVGLSNPAASGTVSGATLLLDGGATSTYDLAGASYDSVSFSVSGQETSPLGLFFKPDGTTFYVVGSSSDTVYQYTLSTAWDLSTASYASKSVSVSSANTSPCSLFFKPDGTKMYVAGFDGDADVNEYDLSIAWDVSTATYLQRVSVDTRNSQPTGLFFNTDGTKMFTCGQGTGVVSEFSLNTAWSVSTALYSQNFSVTSQTIYARGLSFKSDGTKMYITSYLGVVYQYSLSTAFDVSTASYDSVSFDASTQETQPYDLVFKGDGTKLFIVGTTGSNVHQYSTGSEATITYDTAIEWPGGTAPTSPAIGETDVLTFNTRDGGSTYQGVLAIDGAK